MTTYELTKLTWISLMLLSFSLKSTPNIFRPAIMGFPPSGLSTKAPTHTPCSNIWRHITLEFSINTGSFTASVNKINNINIVRLLWDKCLFIKQKFNIRKLEAIYRNAIYRLCRKHSRSVEFIKINHNVLLHNNIALNVRKNILYVHFSQVYEYYLTSVVK